MRAVSAEWVFLHHKKWRVCIQKCFRGGARNNVACLQGFWSRVLRVESSQLLSEVYFGDSGNGASCGIYDASLSVCSPMQVEVSLSKALPANANSWLVEVPVPPLEESWKQPFLQYDFSVSSWCISLSPFYNFRLYCPTFMYLIWGLWSGRWQCLLAVFLNFCLTSWGFQSCLSHLIF